jgi:hypothetical protein
MYSIVPRLGTVLVALIERRTGAAGRSMCSSKNLSTN